MASKWLRMGSIYRVEMLDNEMIHIPDGMEQEGARFHQTTQNDAQFKAWIFHFWNFPFNIFGPWLTQVTETTENETTENETTNKRELQYRKFHRVCPPDQTCRERKVKEAGLCKGRSWSFIPHIDQLLDLGLPFHSTPTPQECNLEQGGSIYSFSKATQIEP